MLAIGLSAINELKETVVQIDELIMGKVRSRSFYPMAWSLDAFLLLSILIYMALNLTHGCFFSLLW